MDTYSFTVERTSTGYSALCESEGALTTASTLAELRKNMVQVLNFAIKDTGRTVTMDNIKAVYDLPSFFDSYKVINAKALAERLGMTQSMLSQYTSGTKKAGPKQAQKILEGVRDLGRELAAMDFAV